METSSVSKITSNRLSDAQTKNKSDVNLCFTWVNCFNTVANSLTGHLWPFTPSEDVRPCTYPIRVTNGRSKEHCGGKYGWSISCCFTCSHLSTVVFGSSSCVARVTDCLVAAELQGIYTESVERGFDMGIAALNEWKAVSYYLL